MHTFGLKGVSLCTVLLMVLVLISTSGAVLSESLPPQLHLETMPYLPENSALVYGIVTRSSGTAMAGPFWTKSVFQSLRNESDWDIYVTQAWNESPMRITSNVANDTQPNLNRGTMRVAFVSDRNDNNEIYTMNTAGKDVRRLTYTEENEYYPVWSPDGNRIAFYAYRNDSIDIYVMNADGSNQTRLTYTGLNRYPSWSPDGSQLVFASYRNNQYGIWIMNADGSNPHQIGTSQPYMQHPLWSWDGQYILYDADSDGDGFNEICLMNADGSQQRTLVNPESYYNEELWANSWMYTEFWRPSQFAFTRLRLVQYGGNWYWQSAQVETQSLTCGWGCYPERLTDTDLDWAISNQTSDVTPPMAWFKPLPEYSRYSDVALEWEQRDDLSSSHQQWLQVRENGGVWTDWIRGTDLDQMPTVYSGTSGSEVAFRIRVGDPSHNWNQWTPDQHVPHTKLYAYDLSGVVRDNRGFPIPHGDVIISRPAVGPVTMGPDGRFALRLRQGGGTQVKVEATGYGIAPAWHGIVATDTSLEFRLLPGDEVVQNGSFGEAGLAPWIPAGDTLPVIITDTQRPDSYAVFLRAQVGVELEDPVVVTSGISLTNITDSALDPSGGVHLLSIRQDGLYYVWRNPSRVWENAEKITSDAAESAAIAVSQDGKVHVIWWGLWPVSSSLFYCERHVNGAWSEPLLLDDGYGADIAVDGFGGVHLAYGHPWDAYTISGFYQYRTPEGIWQEPLNLTMARNGVLIAVGEANNVHMIFRDSGINYFVNEPPYTMPECRSFTGSGGDNLKAVVDNTDTMHLISGLGYYSALGTNPRPVEFLSNAERGMLAVDARQNLYVVGINGDHVYLRYKPAGLEWTPPEVIGEYSGLFTHILSDAAGNLVIGYMQSMYEPVVRDGLPGNTAVSTLSQALAIPADMTKPTLSFDYRLVGTGHFSVTLVSTETTTLFSTTTNVSNWTHAWVDVSPWAGESVTVTFATTAQTPAAELRLYLDDVSLGSWMTPAPQTVDPRVVEAHRTTPITVLGQNFLEGARVYAGNTLLSSVWVSDTQMTAIVPLSLTMGLYPLRIVNPGGPTGYAPQPLQVGRATWMPVLLKAPPWIQ